MLIRCQVLPNNSYGSRQERKGPGEIVEIEESELALFRHCLIPVADLEAAEAAELGAAEERLKKDQAQFQAMREAAIAAAKAQQEARAILATKQAEQAAKVAENAQKAADLTAGKRKFKKE